MKTLITYLLLILCIAASAQDTSSFVNDKKSQKQINSSSEKANELQSQSDEAIKAWRKTTDFEIYQLKRLHIELRALKKEVTELKDKIDALENTTAPKNDAKAVKNLADVLGFEIKPFKVSELPTEKDEGFNNIAYVTDARVYEKGETVEGGGQLEVAVVFVDNNWKMF